jgi:glycosyltransferase involved in cell wall biosynthesis
MRVTYYHRKPVPGNYSIERLFDDVRQALDHRIEQKVSMAPFRSYGIFRRLYNAFYAARRQSDVNHITGDIHYVACFLKKRKTLLTIHDCVTLERLRGIQKMIFFFFWYWLPEKRSELITVVSESTKQELLKYVRCRPNKIRVVPNCASPFFKPTPYSFNFSMPVILQVGTAKNKNLIRLAQALKGISCHLDIVGRLSDQQIEMLQRNRIRYSSVADITDNAIVRKYRDCDMVVFCSTYEGFGLPIVEANAMGRPVVTSNILSMPEVAGDAACLIDPFDIQSIRAGVLRVIEDRDYRDHLIKNGFRNVLRFEPEAVAAQYAAIYKELVVS